MSEKNGIRGQNSDMAGLKVHYVVLGKTLTDWFFYVLN